MLQAVQCVPWKLLFKLRQCEQVKQQKLLRTHRITQESFIQLELKVLLQETGISSGEPSEFLQKQKSRSWLWSLSGCRSNFLNCEFNGQPGASSIGLHYWEEWRNFWCQWPWHAGKIKDRQTVRAQLWLAERNHGEIHTDREDLRECPLSSRTAKEAGARQPSSLHTPSHFRVWLVFNIGN